MIKSLLKAMLFVFVTVNLAACSMVPESIEVQSVPAGEKSNIGHRQHVQVKAQDLRASNMVGRRIGGYGGVAPIKIKSDLVAVLTKSMQAHLAAYDFVPTQQSAPIDIQLRLLSLDYSLELDGSFWGNNNAIVVYNDIEVIAKKKGKTFRKTFKSHQTIKSLFTPTKTADTRAINTVFANNIHKIMRDESFIRFISK